jgi:hypothetical protein
VGLRASLPHSKEFETGFCTETDKFSVHPYIMFSLKMRFDVIFSSIEIPKIFSRVGVTSKAGFWNWMIGVIASLTFTELGTTGNYSAVAALHTLQFNLTYALGFLVFTSRILATDL